MTQSSVFSLAPFSGTSLAPSDVCDYLCVCVRLFESACTCMCVCIGGMCRRYHQALMFIQLNAWMTRTYPLS